MADALRPFLIGTAGHVDHGKTTLVQALTGVNTDRFAEEQRRGMSIDLGFAEFHLPSGRLAGIVDVPGHERFLKNMLAGATGVDFALLVVAADEGVMPQTIEHLAILQALDIPNGLTVITKADLVEPEWLEMVTADVRAALAGTFLEERPIVIVDSVSRRGLDELVATLDATAASLPDADTTRPAFLPVDRVFVRPGFGVVVTGSLRSGRLNVGDSVVIYPSGKPARVRGLQTFGQSEPAAEAGMRTAVNLAGVEAAEIERGDVVAAPGSLTASSRLNVRLHLDRESPPLKHRARVRIHIGTAERLARVLLWEADGIAPGSSGLAQLSLESPSVARRGERFVVRRYSPPDLLGGGVVIEPVASPFRARDAAAADRLRVLERADPDDVLGEALSASRGVPVTVAEIAARTGLPEGALREAANRAVESGVARETPAGLVGARELEAVRKRWTDRVASHHRKSPLQPGLSKEGLRTQDPPPLPPPAFNALLALLQEDGALVIEQDVVRLPDFRILLRPEQEKAAEEILALYRDAGWQPPSEMDVTRTLGRHRATRELWDYLTASGRLVPLGEGLYLHPDTAAAGLKAIRRLLEETGDVRVGAFRDATGSSRRTAVPFLEWCDTQRYTRRLGETRKAGPGLGMRG
jgi:selenocysteine-specific elongation factor